MRIVFVVRRFWPAVGGVEKYVGELAAALLDLGHEVTVLAGAHALDLPAGEVREGVEIRRFPELRSPVRCWWTLVRWAPLVRRADVVHVSDTFMLDYFNRMLGGLVRPRCLCMTIHGMSCVYPVPQREILRARRARALVDGMVHDGAFIGKWLGVSPDLIAPQGLRPTADAIAAQPEPPKPSAVYVGRLAADTGVGLYLDALAVLRAQWGMELPLHVYGSGPLEGALKAKAERERLDVTFHGAQPNAQERIGEHVLAFVSGRMTIHEAMARRRAVIAAYCNPIRGDYVRGEAFSPYILTGADGAEIASHARRLLHRRGERVALVERAWKHVAGLSWERTAREYVGLWESARGRGRRRSLWSRVSLATAMWREAAGSGAVVEAKA